MLRRLVAAVKERWRNRRRTHTDERALERARIQGQETLDTQSTQWRDTDGQRRRLRRLVSQPS